MKQALDMINGGFFSDGPDQFKDIYNSLVHDDRFVIISIFARIFSMLFLVLPLSISLVAKV